MNNLFLNLLVSGAVNVSPDGEKWTLKIFWENITNFFTSDFWITEIIRGAFIALVLFCVIAFLLSGSFLKIVKEEMEKGGEEYGEIAATKVSNRAYLFRVLAVVFGILLVAGLFVALALL